MNLRDFRIGWRLLIQQPAYSAVVTGGLAIGFAACFLLFGYVGYCLDYDSHVPDNDRVFAVKQRINVFPRPEWQINAYLPLRDIAIDSGMVQEASIVKNLDVPLRSGERLHAISLQAVDPAFQALFGIRPLEGDLHAALTQPDGLALTQSAAHKLFGAARPLGQIVKAGDATLQVRALLPDPPANSTQQYEALVGSSGSAWPEADRKSAFAKWSRAAVYLKLRPGVAPAALVPLLQQATNNSPLDQRFKNGALGSGLNGRNVTDVKLLALRDMYFDADLAASRDADNHGQRSSVFGLAAMGVLILLLAAINYVNLATVRTLRRQREIGIRKLLGAGAPRLVRQFLTESVLTTLLAALAALLLAWLLLPQFSDLVNRRLDGMFTPARCLAALLFGLAVGVCAGAYPAWLAQHALPGPALAGRGNSETAAGLWLRRLLTVLQFATAIALSATALGVSWQTHFATHASPGFDPGGLMVLELPDGTEGKPAAKAFIAALRRLPRIDGAAAMTEAVGRDGFKIISTVLAKDGREVPIEAKYVSPEFFQLYRLKPAFGRLYDPARDVDDGTGTSGVILNAAGALALGYESPQAAVGQIPPGGRVPIIGIAPDLRYQGLQQPSKALMYRLAPGPVVTVRTADNLDAAYRSIEPLWRHYFPNDILELRSEQTVLTERYAGDIRLARILALSSLVAIGLAAFGIYVLSAYSVQRSTREIVMRKLHGASRADIALMVGREFSTLVGAGALVGLPLAA
ncbi:MAG TPA: ABC transporter permease, partial [Telluria sp.]|nr:ABC transporter permease [Telluria sp.]